MPFQQQDKVPQVKQPYLKHHRGAAFFLVALSVLFFLSSAEADNLVSGRYQSATGKNIVLSLTIKSPAPITLIVEQQFSGSNPIASTSPKAKKINGSKGRIKWLCKNKSTGKLNLSTMLSSPLQGSVSATVRFKNPGGGGFTTLNIRP